MAAHTTFSEKEWPTTSGCRKEIGCDLRDPCREKEIDSFTSLRQNKQKVATYSLLQLASLHSLSRRVKLNLEVFGYTHDSCDVLSLLEGSIFECWLDYDS